MCTWSNLKNKGVFFLFLILALFVKSLETWFLRDRIFNQFWSFLNLRSNISMSKRSLRSPKITKTVQNHILTKHGVIWWILKLAKICDQGMDIHFFMLRFKICPRGLGFKLRWVFCGVCGKSFQV